jgi:hypothetical protein
MCVLSVLQAELVRVQEDGKRRIAEAKEKGRLQYNELVATIEKRYVAEFESSLKIVKERADADAKVRARVVLCPVAGRAPLYVLRVSTPTCLSTPHRRRRIDPTAA